jgi:hypothetical protein
VALDLALGMKGKRYEKWLQLHCGRVGERCTVTKVLSNTHPEVLVLVIGTKQIQCAFCWERSSLKYEQYQLFGSRDNRVFDPQNKGYRLLRNIGVSSLTTRCYNSSDRSLRNSRHDNNILMLICCEDLNNMYVPSVRRRMVETEMKQNTGEKEVKLSL